MKRILVTGAAGFIGSHLVRHILRTTDWQVVCLDRLDPAGSLERLRDCFHDYRGRVEMVHHDLRSEINDATTLRLLTGNRHWSLERFDYIAHLAASSHVDRAMLQPIVAIGDSVMGTANMLEFVRQQVGLKDGGKFWHMSTDEVMGPAPVGVAFKPADRHFPRNIYAASKSGAEALVFAYAETFGMPLVITRCTNVVAPKAHETDPGQDAEKFLPIVVERLTSGEAVEIHTVNGVPCSRYYVHVHNVCTAGMTVLEKALCIDGTEGGGVFHISGDQELDNVNVVKLAAEVLGREARYRLVERPPGRLKPDLRYCLDDSGLRALGWKTEIGCVDGLRAVVESYKGDSRAVAAQ